MPKREVLTQFRSRRMFSRGIMRTESPLKKRSRPMNNSELREDVITGEWVLIAPGRAKRDKAAKKRARKVTPIKKCVFEDPFKASGGVLPLLEYGKGKSWRLAAIDNKYP